jgi:hypothetical protein
MAVDRISFDKRDAQIIATALKEANPKIKAEDSERITGKIGGYLKLQRDKAKGIEAPAKKAPKAPKAPKAAPAKKAAKAPKATDVAPAKKAPAKKSADKPFKLPVMPTPFDAD